MINAEKLAEAGIDFDAGLKRFMNDTSFYEMVLEAFIGEYMLDDAKAAYDSGNKQALTEIIHAAKGTSGNAGFDNLYSHANTLLNLLRSDNYTEESLSELFEKFSTEYLKVWNGICAALK